MSSCHVPGSYAAAYELLESTLTDSGPSVGEIDTLLEELIEETLSQMKVSEACRDYVRRAWQRQPIPVVSADDYFIAALPRCPFAGYFDLEVQPGFEADVLSRALALHLGDIAHQFIHGFRQDGDLEYFVELIWRGFLYAFQSPPLVIANIRSGCRARGFDREAKHLKLWVELYRDRFNHGVFEKELALLSYLGRFVFVE